MNFSFFHTPKPRQFNYTPRYYDPNQEALEKKKASMGLDSKLSENEKRRMRIRTAYGRDFEEAKEKNNKFGYKRIRYIIFCGLILFFGYAIFATPLLENFFTIFLNLGK